jgi:hypothetical protein
MLVSAVEVAAVEWMTGADDPESILRSLKPKWAARLERDGGAGLVRDMAADWVELLGATNRFIKFVLAHLPDPPPNRPESCQVDWSPKAMKSALQKVYEYRSKALHAGVPFPQPMCRPPDLLPGSDAPVERPWFLASASAGGYWVVGDLPFYLHVFAYLVRGALLKWREELKDQGASGAPSTT